MKRSLWLSTISLLSLLVTALAVAEESEVASTSTLEPRERTVEIHPSVSILSFAELTLLQGGHTFSYDNTMRGIPLIGANFSTPLGALGDFDMFGLFRMGYGTKYSEVDMDGTGTQSVRLHAIPLAAMLKARYQIHAVPSIKPALVMGVGNYFFYQSARESGHTASYFIPTVITGFSLALFDPGKAATDWFGGFNFGINYQHGLSSENRLRAFSFDLGIVVIL